MFRHAAQTDSTRHGRNKTPMVTAGTAGLLLASPESDDPRWHPIGGHLHITTLASACLLYDIVAAVVFTFLFCAATCYEMGGVYLIVSTVISAIFLCTTPLGVFALTKNNELAIHLYTVREYLFFTFTIVGGVAGLGGPKGCCAVLMLVHSPMTLLAVIFMHFCAEYVRFSHSTAAEAVLIPHGTDASDDNPGSLTGDVKTARPLPPAAFFCTSEFSVAAAGASVPPVIEQVPDMTAIGMQDIKETSIKCDKTQTSEISLSPTDRSGERTSISKTPASSLATSRKKTSLAETKAAETQVAETQVAETQVAETHTAQTQVAKTINE